MRALEHPWWRLQVNDALAFAYSESLRRGVVPCPDESYRRYVLRLSITGLGLDTHCEPVDQRNARDEPGAIHADAAGKRELESLATDS